MISSWNIRDLNAIEKHKAIRLFIEKYKIILFGCLESRIKFSKKGNVQRKCFPN